MSRSRRYVHLLVLLTYVLLALALTFPVVTDPGRLVPGSDTWAYDEYTFLWNTWWLKHSAMDAGVSPLHTDLTFYPVGVPLVLYTFNFVGSALALPLYLIGNLPLATNLVLWAMMALSGYSAYLLCAYLMRRMALRASAAAGQIGAFVAGLAYAFPASRFIYLALGHYIYVMVATLPIFAYFVLRTFDSGVAWKRYAVFAGLCFAITALVEMTFALFMAILLGILALFYWRRMPLRSLIARLALIVGLSLLFYSPLLIPVLWESVRGNYAITGWGDALRLSADLVGLLVPTALHPLWGSDWPQHLRDSFTGAGRFSDVHTLFLGFGTLALSAVALVRYGRRLLPWLITALTSVVLALGPLLQINGRYVFDLDGLSATVPMPFILLHYIPLASAGRAPNRFGVLAVLALAPLVGIGAYWLLSHYRRWWATGLVGALAGLIVLLDGFSVPLPTTDASVPMFYHSLAQEEGDFSILSLPFGVRSSFGTLGAERTQLQYYQSVHEKRFIGGNISRAPAINFNYYQRVRPLAQLLAIQGYQAPPEFDRAEERRQAAELAALLDLRYLVVQAPVSGRLPYEDTFDEAFAYAASVFDLTEVARDPEGLLVAYRVRQAEIPPDLTLDLSQDATSMYLGQGWSYPESIAGAPGRWIEGTTAEAYLPVDEPGERTLTLTAAPFTFAGAQEQGLTLSINGHRVGRLTLAPSWQQYSVTLPAEVLRAGLNRLQLRFSYAARPVDVSSSGYHIGGTGVQAPVHLEVNSRPELAYITIGDADGSRHADGINVALFDATNGTLIGSAAFGWDQGAGLFDYLQRAKTGTGVAIAVQGRVPAAVDSSVCRAFQVAGATSCPTHGSDGYALLGVTGATPGSAMEATGESGYLRISPDDRALSAAVSSLSFAALP